jgi:putative nucleotidyltransferase with HDIG domain
MSGRPNRNLVRTRVERLTSVMTIPHVVARITALVDSRQATASEIADELSQDQVLVAKLLKLVNSGFYGFPQPITTVSRATVLLGQDLVKTLVLCASVIGVMDKMNHVMEGLWEHSLATARAASLLSEQLGVGKPEEVALSGLLHDVGKVIITQAFPVEAQRIRKLIAERDCLQIEAELEVLGVGHPEIGLWLLSRWALPAELVAPIAYHSSFHVARDFADRTAVVHLADIIARALGLGNPGDGRIPRIHPDAWKVLGVTTRQVDVVCRQLDGEAMLRQTA